MMGEPEKKKRMRGKVGVKCYQAYTDNVWTNIHEIMNVNDFF